MTSKIPATSWNMDGATDDGTTLKDSQTRRRFLAVAGSTVAATTLAGCLGGSEAEDSRCEDDDVTAILPARENGVPIDDPPFPTHGEPIPEHTIPAPLHDREVTTTEFVCDRHQLYTFVFTRCHEACPALTSTLVQAHADSISEGYADDVAFVQISFDPEHDTPEVIADYEETHSVDPDPGHWYTLRPETEERAKEVVHESFGQEYTKVEDEGDQDEDDDGMDPGDLDGIGDEVTGDDDHDDDDEMQMPFMHISLILLVNKAGYVERAYAYDVPTAAAIIDDTRELADSW